MAGGHQQNLEKAVATCQKHGEPSSPRIIASATALCTFSDKPDITNLHQHKYVKELKQHQTKAERKFFKLLLRCLRDNFPELPPGAGVQVPIRHSRGFYVLDFYIGCIKLAFEIDGGYHWQNNQLDRDLKRDATLQKEKHIRVYHIPNRDALASGARRKILEQKLIVWIKNRIETREWVKRRKLASKHIISPGEGFTVQS